MAENPSEANPLMGQLPQPDPALRRLDRLVGTWEMTGRTLESNKDDITGRVVIDWMPGGFFLEQRGEIIFQGFKVQSVEIVGYDPTTNTFPAQVYSNIGGTPMAYFWDVQGDEVTHWTAGSKYTGRFSADGIVLAGGWRPDPGNEDMPGATYDATMIRVR